MPRLNLNLQKKLLLAICAVSLLPLLLLLLGSWQSLLRTETMVRQRSTAAMDKAAAHTLEMRARQVARRVEDFLISVEGDLKDLQQQPVTPQAYWQFYQNHQRRVWYLDHSRSPAQEVQRQAPLYKDIAFIKPSGQERLRLFQGQLQENLRNVAQPDNTRFGSHFFRQTLKLEPGQIFVSHLMGRHVGRQQQQQGQRYQGHIRFAAPVYRDNRLQGVVTLALDHQHLQEMTRHIDSTSAKPVLAPSYEAGNYAFLFDDQGWIITHPKLWDIRGLDAQNRLVPPYSPDSTPQQIRRGRIPYNLFFAAFIHPHYPQAAAAVLQGQSGVVDVTNVGGSQKVMAYAPIAYNRGQYRHSGYFGGVTIGAEVKHFHAPAQAIAGDIRRQFQTFRNQSLVLVALTIILVLVAAHLLARGITTPLRRLLHATRTMAQGHLRPQLPVTAHDEVGELTAAFNRMGAQLYHRRERLLRTLGQLRASRNQITLERNFKEAIVEQIDTGIVTLDGEGQVTSCSGPARQMLALGDTACHGWQPDQLLPSWPDCSRFLERWRQQPKQAQNMMVQATDSQQTWRLTLLPVRFEGSGGYILTLQDITERLAMHRQVERMERLASLGRFSAAIAHEIRNPLTGISIFLDELHDRMLAHPEDQQLIQQALNEMERLENLVGELLNFARQPEGQRQYVELSQLLQETLMLVSKACEKAQVVLDQHIPEGLPPIWADPGRIKQALLNLLRNALEAMPEGGHLRLAAQTDNGMVQLCVADTGGGISGEEQPYIFEPFYSTKKQGSGLGLAITYNIITEHGGSLDMHSSSPAGTVFCLTLPVKPGAEESS